MTDHDVLAVAQRLGSRALAWLDASHETGFGELDDNITIDIGDPNSSYKPIGECALAASLVLREGVTGAADAERARRMLAFGWSQLRDGNLLYERQLRHLLLTDPLEVYAHFVRAGYRHPPLEDLVRSLADLRSMHAAETVPTRRLAVANARRVAGLDHRGPDWDTLAASTWLGATPEPWAMDWGTGYDVTHAVFHLTDWGAHPEYLPEPMRDYVRDWLPVWLDIWLEVGQWDLSAELLVVDACLAEPVTGRQGWDALAAVQREDGLVPRDDSPVAEEPEQAFKDHEHTAVVAVVASTVMLSRALGGARTAPA